MKLGLCFVQALGFVGFASAAYNIYLVAAGFEGESTDSQYPKSIQITEASFGVANTAGEKPQFADFSMQKKLDKSSVAFQSALLKQPSNQPFNFYFRKAGSSGNATTFRTLTFTYPSITSYSYEAAPGGDDSPEEKITFSFGKYQDTYRVLNAKGQPGATYTVSWDLSTNSGSRRI